MGHAESDPQRAPAATKQRQAHRDFGEMHQASYRVLWVIAAGIVGDRSSAEDIVNEAAHQALMKSDLFQAGTNFTAWMARFVRFVALNHVRRERKHLSNRAGNERLEHIADLRTAGAGTQLKLSAAGKLPDNQPFFDDEVMTALKMLTEKARACMLLRVIEGLDYRQIGELLGMPEGTAMSHVHRSRRTLRKRLQHRQPNGSTCDG